MTDATVAGATVAGATVAGTAEARIMAKASVSDFDYSLAFTMLGGDWTIEAVNEFLARPFEVTPGTKTEFLGEADPQQRANRIA